MIDETIAHRFHSKLLNCPQSMFRYEEGHDNFFPDLFKFIFLFIIGAF